MMAAVNPSSRQHSATLTAIKPAATSAIARRRRTEQRIVARRRFERLKLAKLVRHVGRESAWPDPEQARPHHRDPRMAGAKRAPRVASHQRRAKTDGALDPVPLVGRHRQIEALKPDPDRHDEDQQDKEHRGDGAPEVSSGWQHSARRLGCIVYDWSGHRLHDHSLTGLRDVMAAILTAMRYVIGSFGGTSGGCRQTGQATRQYAPASLSRIRPLGDAPAISGR